MPKLKLKKQPPCVRDLGCACAGHANGLAVSKPCDTAEPDTTIVCCATCGSDRVEYAVWFNPNTQRDGELFGSWNAGDNTHCADCDTNGRDPNPSLLDSRIEPELFAKARKKFLKATKTA